MTDITAFINTFIDSFISFLSSVFDILSNITFAGFSLLTYIIALFVLGAAIPLVVTLLNNRSVGVSYIPRTYRNVRGSFRRRLNKIDEMWDISDE